MWTVDDGEKREIADLLLRHGAAVDAQVCKKLLFGPHISKTGPKRSVTQNNESKGRKQNAFLLPGITCLMWSQQSTAEYFLRAGANVNAVDHVTIGQLHTQSCSLHLVFKAGKTALIHVIMRQICDRNFARILCENGADVNICDQVFFFSSKNKL